VSFAKLETPVGTLTLVAGALGVRAVLVSGEAPAQGTVGGAHPLLASAARQLREYFAGERGRRLRR
jgi:hypothetical protein